MKLRILGGGSLMEKIPLAQNKQEEEKSSELP